MKKWILAAVAGSTLAMLFLLPVVFRNNTTRSAVHAGEDALHQRLHGYGEQARLYCKKHGLNTTFCFLADMRLPSGQNRFFIYDLVHDSITATALVAHGSCNTFFLSSARFSNKVNSGCTSKGRYKTGGKYAGRFGTAYKLFGLDSTNSHAYERNVVLHSYTGVPDSATYPYPIMNSLGCPMVSTAFLKMLSNKIDHSRLPVLLWIFD